MFTSNTQFTGYGSQRSQRAAITKITAVAVTIGLGAGLSLVAPLSASADTTHRSYAQGRFLSGTVLGINLDDLAALEATTAKNNGSQSTQVNRDPLGVSALRTTIIHQPAGLQLNLGQIIDLGAVNQYARAGADGSSAAASGAISSDGGVGVGSVGSGEPGSATVDLDSLLGSRFDKVLTDLKIEADALGAQAAGKLNTASGKYSLAGLKLHLTSPAIANLSGRVSNALSPVRSQLGSLDGRTGDLSKAVSGVVQRINPALNLLGAHASVSSNIDANLTSALKPLLTGHYVSNGVDVNLQTGDVSVDLAALLGGKINSQPAGTEVLSDTVVNQILRGITHSISTLADQILAKVRGSLLNAKVTVNAALDTSTPQAPIIGKKCTDPGDNSDDGLIGGLVGGVVGSLVCTTTTKLLPDLKTSLDVHVDATVNQLISGTAANATATLKLLGVPVKVNVNGIIGSLGGTLKNHLFDSSSAVSSLTDSLHTRLIDPAVTGLLGSGSSVEKALTDVVSVKLNNQDTTTGTDGKVFTETALRVAVLPTLGSTAATVNLAQASVGPNVTRVVDPGTPSDPGCTVNCTPTQPGTPSDPGCTVACTPIGGGSGLPITSTALGNLAFTGVGIGPLISLILALLAAGAYLVREGYRRNSRRQSI